MISKKLRIHLAMTTFLLCAATMVAQDVKLKIQVTPADASIFVDGQPCKHSAGTIEVSPGEHTIGAYNYGFASQVQKVTVKAGENPDLAFKLEPLPGEVDSPWGNLQIKGVNGGYFVFLNGKEPEYFIGRVEEMRGNRIVLPPGQQHVIIVNPDGNRQVYSGYVVVKPNERAVLHVDKSDTYYEKWADGTQLHSLPRVGPTTVALEPVKGQVAAYPSVANCGQPVRLVWTSNGYNTMLKYKGSAVAQAGSSGEQIVNPKQTTTYQLETFGPGGVTMTPVTVTVNNAVKTALNTTPTVIRYHKVGDKVIEPASATLNWSATNAESVTLEPIGPVSGTSGQQPITYSPSKTDFGPVAETMAYKITATNTCGGSDSTTAQVQVAGSIDPEMPPEYLPIQLPQTASPLPLIGLLGLGSLASGLVLRKMRKN